MFGGTISFVEYICLFAAEVWVSVKEVCNANCSDVSRHRLIDFLLCTVCVFTVQKCCNYEELFTCLNVNLQTRRGKSERAGLTMSTVDVCFLRFNSGVLRMWFTVTSLKFIFRWVVEDWLFIMKSQDRPHVNSLVSVDQTWGLCAASLFVLLFQTMLMWAGPDIASCWSCRLCVMWCVRLMICRGECQVKQMWC